MDKIGVVVLACIWERIQMLEKHEVQERMSRVQPPAANGNILFQYAGHRGFAHRRHKIKRRPSIHQKQMRFFTIMFVVVSVALFTLIFYFFNRSINGWAW
ncbi:MAG TPA: hypothetical protein VMH30_02240 [Verrucomicrobiae bacterium]|nr:hypothetical protein [Verrucomicrobiae bacterium]